jgi:flagellar assembly protein FliH
MDPIIRAASVSAVPRQLKRVTAVAPAAAAAPVAASPKQEAVAPFVPTATMLAAREKAPVAVPAKDDAALQARDAEIVKLRAELRAAADASAETFADAQRRGMESGEKKGLEQGERMAREQLQGQIERVQAVLAQVSQARAKLMDEAEDALVEIAFAAVCRILGEDGADQATLQRVVRETMSATREREQLVVRLHPDDAAWLEIDGAPDVRVSADHGIALGGCMIDSASGTLDARFETQLALLAAALKTARAERRAAKDAV